MTTTPKTFLQSCYLCKSTEVSDFFSMPPVPTQDGVMCDSAEDALKIKKGNILLRYCKSCGYIGNESHTPSNINFDNYDFSNDFSPLFGAYVNRLCEDLIARYDLRNKTILDVGCGDGFFLQKICQKGNNKGIGIDSGFNHSKRKNVENLDIQFIQNYYSSKYKNLQADFIACRLVVDLLSDPIPFLKMMRSNLENHPDTIVFFEVPNAEYTFKENIIWNVVYEHRSWFTKESLARFFEFCGFEVLHVNTLWNDEFLGITAIPKFSKTINKSNSSSQELNQIIENFNNSFTNCISACKEKIEEIKKSNTRCIAWAAGARAVTFFNLFDLKEMIPFVVDINVKRHGKYIPGSGQQIVNPEFIIDYQAKLIVITNPTYAEEIKEQVWAMGLNPEFWIL